MLRALAAAFALLTVFPVPLALGSRDFRRGVAFFPLVGYALGGFLALLALLPLPPGLQAALQVALLLGLTGFLHLDGLLDAADALLGYRSREDRLRILKDPHLGPFAFGVGGLYLLLLWQALALAPEPLFLLLFPGFARFAFLPFLHLYPLLGPGMAAAVRGGPWGLALLLALPFPLLFPLPALSAFLAAFGVARLALSRLGGLNGDILGAMISLAELFALLCPMEAPRRLKPYTRPQGERRGLLIVYTGDGKGKSTAAFGLALRAHGRGLKVRIFQFIKHGTARFGEHRAFALLGIPIEGLGDGFTWRSRDLARSAALAQEGWGRAKEALLSGTYDLVVLDEATYPLRYGWVSLEEFLEVLRARPPHVHVVVTGRGAPEALLELADTVTEMRKVKHAFDQGVPAQRGIEH